MISFVLGLGLTWLCTAEGLFLRAARASPRIGRRVQSTIESPLNPRADAMRLAGMAPVTAASNPIALAFFSTAGENVIAHVTWRVDSAATRCADLY